MAFNLIRKSIIWLESKMFYIKRREVFKISGVVQEESHSNLFQLENPKKFM